MDGARFARQCCPAPSWNKGLMEISTRGEIIPNADPWIQASQAFAHPSLVAWSIEMRRNNAAT